MVGTLLECEKKGTLFAGPHVSVFRFSNEKIQAKIHEKIRKFHFKLIQNKVSTEFKKKQQKTLLSGHFGHILPNLGKLELF